jgi:hypothetical protein
VHLLVRRHFEIKNNAAPQGHNLESDQANWTDVADRGTCNLAVFGALLCPGGGGILNYMQAPQARNLRLSLHGVLPGTKVAGSGSDAGSKLAPAPAS